MIFGSQMNFPQQSPAFGASSPMGGAGMQAQMFMMMATTMMSMMMQLMESMVGQVGLPSSGGFGQPGAGFMGGSPLGGFLGGGSGGGMPMGGSSGGGAPFTATGSGANLGPMDGSVTPSTQNFINEALKLQGTPYVFGATGPNKFDCSGLVWRVLEQHGVLVMRNSSEMCFRDPQLVPVTFEALAPGDLVFFGTEEKIDHVGFWAGGGRVLQATSSGVPSTQETPWENERMAPRFRHARRLASLPGAPRPSGLTPAKAEALGKALDALAAGTKATFGIVVKDLQTGETLRRNATTTMHAASTMKTAVLLEALRRVEEGTLSLSTGVPVVACFPSAFDGSPYEVGMDPESEGRLAPYLGKSARLDFLAREMIVRSSNVATNLMLGLCPPKDVQRFVDALGAGSVKVRRGVADEKAFEAGFSNETDAEGMAALMEAAVRSPRLAPETRRLAFEILAGQEFNEQIPAGLPKQAGAVVAHKTGSISKVQHDAAVVRLPDGREYVLVLLATDFGANEEGRKKVIETTRKMSRAVWEAMIAP